MKMLLHNLALSLFIVLSYTDSIQTFLDYNKQYQWPQPCASGLLQSPINILINDKIQQCPPSINYKITEDSHGAQIKVNYDSNSQGLRNPFQSQTFITLTQNSNQKTYSSQQFHWHTPSEHKINGKQYDLQLHIFHQSLDADGKSAVAALLFNLVDDNTETIFDKVDFFNQNKTYHFPLTLSGKQLYYYKGSLTIPPCTEVVDWFVFRNSYGIKKSDLNRIINLKNNGQSNSRKSQRLNDRPIYFLRGGCNEEAKTN